MGFSEKIRRLREERRLSQADLAKDVGVTPQLISLLEKGQRDPSLKIIKKIANALGVTASYLISGESRIKTIDLLEDPVMKEMIKLLEKLPERERHEVAKFAKFRYDNVKGKF